MQPGQWLLEGMQDLTLAAEATIPARFVISAPLLPYSVPCTRFQCVAGELRQPTSLSPRFVCLRVGGLLDVVKTRCIAAKNSLLGALVHVGAQKRLQRIDHLFVITSQ